MNWKVASDGGCGYPGLVEPAVDCSSCARSSLVRCACASCCAKLAFSCSSSSEPEKSGVMVLATARRWARNSRRGLLKARRRGKSEATQGGRPVSESERQPHGLVRRAGMSDVRPRSSAETEEGLTWYE